MKYITKLTRKENIANIYLLLIETLIFSYLLLGDIYVQKPIAIILTVPLHFAVAYGSSFLHFEVMFHIRSRFPLYHQNLFRAMTIILTFGAMTATTLYLVFYGYDWLNIYDYKVNTSRLSWALMIGLIFNVVYAITFEAFYIEKKWGDDAREKEALRQANLVSQFESLKAQVNPHFLFNCLNSLSYLIAQNPTQAEEFVDEMSSVYRYLLRNNEQGLVTIKTEIEFIKSYYHLQKTRFGDGIELSITINAEDDWETMIPPLTLQMLLENAVKHNMLRKTAPLYVDISTSEGYLHIRNNIQQKSNQYIVSTRVGLANTQNKYKLINKSEILIHNDGKHFSVSLPLIKNETFANIGYEASNVG